MMPSLITRSDRPLTHDERLAGWYEAARRHAMRADLSALNASPHRLSPPFLKTDGGDRCEAQAKRGAGQQ